MDTPRYLTLKDYVRVLRSHALLIVLVTAVFAVGTYLIVSQQSPEYAAESSLSFKDPTSEFKLVGVNPAEADIPATERAAIKAETITRPEVLSQLRRRLHNRYTVDELEGRLSARAAAQTNLVVLEARSGSPESAARLANAFGRTVRDVETKATEKRFSRAARSLRREFARARRREPLGSAYIRALAEETIARLQAIRDFGEPVEIARAAEVPENPVSPHKIRDPLFGALLGLAFGIVAAFVRDALDVRFRNPGQIQRELGMPLVGQVASSAFKAPKPGSNGVAPLSEADLEGFHILRANLDFLDSSRPLRSLAVTSAIPEEGKSTVAASLAYASAIVGRRTLLVECDLRRPSLARRLGLATAPGLSDYLAGSAQSTDVLQQVAIPGLSANGKGSDGQGSEPGGGFVQCIVAGKRAASPVELVGSDRFRDFLSVVSRAYDLVILDCGPLLPIADTLEVLPSVDALLLCVRMSQTTRDQAKAARSALSRVGDRPAGLVVTGIDPQGQIGYYDYGYEESKAET
jgi:succinoglycan biosynthesis transport protein ExoP